MTLRGRPSPARAQELPDTGIGPASSPRHEGTLGPQPGATNFFRPLVPQTEPAAAECPAVNAQNRRAQLFDWRRVRSWTAIGAVVGIGIGLAALGYAVTQQRSDAALDTGDWLLGPVFIVLALTVPAAQALLRDLREGLLFGIPAVMLTVMLTIGVGAVTFDATKLPALLAFLPTCAGSWVAAGWCRDLANRGLSYQARIEATATVRGLAWTWNWVLTLALVAVFSSDMTGNSDISDTISGDLSAGIASLLGIAAIAAYGGRGYTEYQKGRGVESYVHDVGQSPAATSGTA
jgi:hypothetical protein